MLESLGTRLFILMKQNLLNLFALEPHVIFFATLVLVIEAANHKGLGHQLLHFLREIRLATILYGIEFLYSFLCKTATTIYSSESVVMSKIEISLFVWISHSA